MKHKIPTGVAAIATFTILSTPVIWPVEPVAAADFTLKVPVHIQNLDERIVRITVTCNLFGKDYQGNNVLFTKNRAEEVVDRDTGSVDTVFEIPLIVSSSIGDPRDATSYDCQLGVITNYGSTINQEDELGGCDQQVYVYASNSSVHSPKILIRVGDQTQPCRTHFHGTISSQQ